MDLGLLVNLVSFGLLLMLQILISIDEARRENKEKSFNIIELEKAA